MIRVSMELAVSQWDSGGLGSLVILGVVEGWGMMEAANLERQSHCVPEQFPWVLGSSVLRGTWGPQYHHLINLAHPALLQIHLGPQEALCSLISPRHAKVHAHTICGSRGGSHCKAESRSQPEAQLQVSFPSQRTAFPRAQ